MHTTNGQAPKMEVKCGVDNCYYNQSQMCHANSLQVNTIDNSTADAKDDTQCTTFRTNQ